MQGQLNMREQEEKKKRKKGEKEKRKEEEKGRRKTTYSLPSLRERSETPGALDRRALGITGGEPVAQNRPFSFGPPVTGVLAVGGVVENRYVYGAAQTPTRLFGRQMFRTPVCKRTRRLDFPPKLESCMT